MAKIYVMGLDCSFNNCGWSIIEHETKSNTRIIKDAGIIDNSAKILNGSTSIDDILRCHRLSNEIFNGPVAKYSKIINQKSFALEVPGGSQSSRAASCLGMARGILGSIITAVTNLQITKHEILLVKPVEVHKQATGSNKATKEEIMDYVETTYKNQILKVVGKRSTIYNIKNLKLSFNKGTFEHVADSIVISELGLEKMLLLKPTKDK